jgi:hypothetical protein
MPDSQYNLADLDELLLKCRDERAREYLREAVSSYKAGAYRASIVTTWIAVLFDLFDKFRELASMGDLQAQVLVKKIEVAVETRKIDELLSIERNALENARDDFQIITSIECEDLKRLQEDRNRCAHPSFNGADEYYSPSAELSRTHIRNAVEYLLRHPPTQGKAALARLQQDIDSIGFPVVVDEAVTHLQYGPLLRPRESLVRDFVRATVSSVLDPTLGQKVRYRRCIALAAARRMHPVLVDKAVKEKLSVSFRQTSDEDIPLCVHFLKMVPDCWQFLDIDVKERIKNFVQECSVVKYPATLVRSLEDPELKEIATARLSSLTVEEVVRVVGILPRPELIDRAIKIYGEVSSFDEANGAAAKLIIPLIPLFKPQQTQNLLAAIAANNQILGSNKLGGVKVALDTHGLITLDEFDHYIEEYAKTA